MKKLSLALAALALCGGANALTAQANFNVSVNFTAACVAKAPATLAFGPYTANGAALTGSATVGFECSRNTTVTGVAFIGGGNVAVFPNANLQYTLSLQTGSISSSGGTPASTSTVGEPDTLGVLVNGTLPQQWGDRLGNNPTSGETVSRTIEITF